MRNCGLEIETTTITILILKIVKQKRYGGLVVLNAIGPEYVRQVIDPIELMDFNKRKT